MRSIRHAEERLRGDLRAAERELASEKDYSSRVKRERDELRSEIKDVLEEKTCQQEKIRDLQGEMVALRTRLEEADKAGGAARCPINKKGHR